MSSTTVDVDSVRQVVVGMRQSFRRDLVPAVTAFIDNESSAEALRQAWLDYYHSAVAQLDSALSPIVSTQTGQSTGITDTDPLVDEPISGLEFYPLSVSHHNLHRLVEVLYDELGDATVDTTEAPQRAHDLAVVVDSLDALYERLSTPASGTPTTGAHHD